jgi:lipoprotein-releasing system permease protein
MLASAGIATGVMALIVVLGVMGGLQGGYIDSILEISSFHLRAELSEDLDAGILEAIRTTENVKSAILFKESHALATGPSGTPATLSLRAFEADTRRLDPELVAALGMDPASPEAFPLPGRIILGKEAQLRLGVRPGDPVELFGIVQSQEEGAVPATSTLTAAPAFSSGYYEFDAGMAFVAMDEVSMLAPAPRVLGIKLHDRYRDYDTLRRIQALLPASAGNLTSWREYNRSFFGALKTEKTIMMLLVSLIFAVVGINIFHAMRRTIASKMTDIALLKACGATDADIRSIFVLDGLSIGAAGAISGLLLGLLVGHNINAILDTVAAALRFLAGILSRAGTGAGAQDYRLFSPASYYIEKIPVHMSAGELLFIAFLAIASTTIAARAASRRVSEARPSEVFRNE